MLVLGRKENEAIRIGERIVVRVVGIRGNKVRLGIEAPADVSVVRDELPPLPPLPAEPLEPTEPMQPIEPTLAEVMADGSA